MTDVSRVSITRADGRKPCRRCGRPVTRRRSDVRDGLQSYCNGCFADIERERRAGRVQVQLWPGEWDAVKRLRDRSAAWWVRA